MAQPLIQNIAAKLFGGGGKKEQVFGFSHPGVDRGRMNDAIYVEAVRRAEAAHQQMFNVSWTDGSPTWAVQRDIEAQYKSVLAEVEAVQRQQVQESPMSSLSDLLRDGLQAGLRGVSAQLTGIPFDPFSMGSRVIPDSGPLSVALPGGAPVMQAAWPAALGSIGRIFGGGAAGGAMRLGAGGLVGAAAGVIRSAAGRIRGVMTASGRFISSRKAAALARRVGIEAAAVGLGVGAVELAEMVLADAETKGRQRGRGVSGADLKRTRRTIRKVESMHRFIQHSCRGAGISTHRRPRTITVSRSPGVITRSEASRALRR